MATVFGEVLTFYNLIAAFAMISAAGGKFSTSFSDVAGLRSSGCGSYCNLSGQLVPAQQCGHHQVCCGQLRFRRCCSVSDAKLESSQIVELWKDSTCEHATVVADNNGNSVQVEVQQEIMTSTSTTTKSWPMSELPVIHWWWFIMPLLIIIILFIILAVCYCIRYKDSSRQRQPTHRPHEERPHSSSSSQRQWSRMDFDPSSIYAFAPPPYESLPKDPPTYAEIICNVNESFWMDENDDDDDQNGSESLPPYHSRRSSSDESQTDNMQQQSDFAMTPEPPFVEVIY